jgi:hypothetical protein
MIILRPGADRANQSRWVSKITAGFGSATATQQMPDRH